MRKAIRYLITIMTIMLLIVLPGCKANKVEESSENFNFDIKAATNVINTYMQNLMKESYDSNKKLYAKELIDAANDTNSNEVKIKGYNVTEINEVGRSGLFKVKVIRTDMKKVAASLDEYTIKVIKDGTEYKISEINDKVEKECFLEDKGIRERSKTDVKTNLVLDDSGIPQYAFSKDDKAQIYKNLVPKANFGTIEFSYSGEKLGFSTFDNNAYIGIVSIDESMATQGSADEKSSGGGQENNGGSSSKAKEKPIGKEVLTLDLIKDSRVQFITFSLDEKFALVQYTKTNYGRCIRVYKTDSGELIPIKFEENYDLKKVEVIFSSFDKDILNYEIVAKGNIDKSQTDIIGKWKLDLKEFKVKKL